MAAGPTAVNPPQRPAPVGLDRRTDGQWDRQTDGRTHGSFINPAPRATRAVSLMELFRRQLSMPDSASEYTASQKKTRRQTLAHNFTKYQPIFVFLLTDLVVNLQQTLG